MFDSQLSTRLGYSVKKPCGTITFTYITPESGHSEAQVESHRVALWYLVVTLHTYVHVVITCTRAVLS
jgi:hypothetical protein